MDFVPVRPAEGGAASRLWGVCSSILGWTSLQESCTAGDVNSLNLNKYLEVESSAANIQGEADFKI